MKIECEVYEFEALQNKAALEKQAEQIKNLTVSLASAQNENERIQDRWWEAQDKIRKLEQPQTASPIPHDLSLSQLSEIFDCYHQKTNYNPGGPDKISAIKKVREVFKCDLKIAKDVVEGNFHKESFKF
jgi:hypothetical protein